MWPVSSRPKFRGGESHASFAHHGTCFTVNEHGHPGNGCAVERVGRVEIPISSAERMPLRLKACYRRQRHPEHHPAHLSHDYRDPDGHGTLISQHHLRQKGRK